MCGLPEMATSFRNRRRRLKPNEGERHSKSGKNMMKVFCPSALLLACALATVASAQAQTTYSWEQIKAHFESANPVLKADEINVDEMKAEEITAFLRPNPQYTVSTDGTQLVPHNGAWQPTKGTMLVNNFAYLHERQHKRELRLESA